MSQKLPSDTTLTTTNNHHSNSGSQTHSKLTSSMTAQKTFKCLPQCHSSQSFCWCTTPQLSSYNMIYHLRKNCNAHCVMQKGISSDVSQPTCSQHFSDISLPVHSGKPIARYLSLHKEKGGIKFTFTIKLQTWTNTADMFMVTSDAAAKLFSLNLIFIVFNCQNIWLIVSSAWSRPWNN